MNRYITNSFFVARSVSTLGTTNFFPDLVPARKSTLAPCAQCPLAFLPRREDPLLAEQHLNRNAHIPKPASVEQSPDHRGQPNAVIDPPRSDLGKMAEDGEKRRKEGEKEKREKRSATQRNKKTSYIGRTHGPRCGAVIGRMTGK